ncbi:MAG: hypothetical protein HY042_13280 [Spirochaetia bacterium]|nr:hypothetical protein [Spirochaetia bacterium]
MPYNVSHNVTLNIIEITLWGEISVDHVTGMVKAYQELSTEHGTERVLSDHSGVTATASRGEFFEVHKAYDSAGLGRRLKVSLVMPASSEIRETLKFYETVMTNRGYKYQAFAEREQALSWLLAP